MIGTGSPPPISKPHDCTIGSDGTPDHWDPKPDERTLYRDKQTGDLGYLVRRNGRDLIRLDRPGQEIIRKLEDFDEENEFRPYNLHQVATLAFESDKLLAKMQGNHTESRREWMSQPEHERIRFMQHGPKEGGLRGELFAAIMGVLKPHAR